MALRCKEKQKLFKEGFLSKTFSCPRVVLFALLFEFGELQSMVVGFNHNFRYKGAVYHIQTEDSGLRNPNIVTLLYHGGTILASKKTSYADIARIDNLEQVVEELMKEQHKEMLRRLKSGGFDEQIDRYQAGKKLAPQAPDTEHAAAPPVTAKPHVAEPLRTPPGVVPVAAPTPEPVAKPGVAPAASAAAKDPSSTAENSLDEVILSYLMGDD